LPHTIGLIVPKLGVSHLVIGAEAVIPELADLENLDGFAGQFNFQRANDHDIGYTARGWHKSSLDTRSSLGAAISLTKPPQ